MTGWKMVRGLLGLLSLPAMMACAGFGKKLTLDANVMDDTTLVAGRGTTNGPWPRVLTDKRNPGPSLTFTHNGTTFTPNSYTRARVTNQGLLVCGRLHAGPNMDPHLGCYVLKQDGSVHTIWMEPDPSDRFDNITRLLPTSQGNLLRHQTLITPGKRTHVWQIWRDGSWEDLPRANGYTDLDESPGAWWGLRPLPNYQQQGAGWTKADGTPLETLTITRHNPHIMAASGHDQALITQYDWAKLWKPDGTEDLLPPATAPDGSKEGFQRATWGPPGPYERDIIVWSSRAKGQVKTSFDATNAVFHPFRRKPDGSFEQAANFTSSVWEPVWAPGWVDAHLCAPR